MPKLDTGAVACCAKCPFHPGKTGLHHTCDAQASCAREHGNRHMTTNILLMALALGASTCLVSAQDDNRPRERRPPATRDDGDQVRPRDRGPREGMQGERPQRDFLPRRPMLPIIAVLDANGDGIIDAKEIKNASKALKKLDKNGDGKLTRDEFLPPLPQGMRGPGPRGFGPQGGAGFRGQNGPGDAMPGPDGQAGRGMRRQGVQPPRGPVGPDAPEGPLPPRDELPRPPRPPSE